MRKPINFVWFDDSPEREATAKSLAKAIKAEYRFVNVKDGDLDNIINKYLSESIEPDLIIMDHFLDNTSSKTFRKGSTAATFIHEVFTECPIISVTAVDIKKDVDTRQKSAYEDMYPDNEISAHYKTIESIALGFRKLKRKRPESIDDIVKYFDCPEEDIERFCKILPIEIKEKENLKDKSLLIEMNRWFRHTLIERPGFLYDRIWAATYLGLTPKGFDTVSEQFKNARYKGVFADESNNRWWKSKLTELVVKKTGEIGLPWEIGRKLVNDKKYYSKCYVSDEQYPETVAAEDETEGAQWHPMKLKYTEPHPSYEDLLFFENLRIIK